MPLAGSQVQGYKVVTHLKKLDHRNKHTNYEQCTLYRSVTLKTADTYTDKHKDRQRDLKQQRQTNHNNSIQGYKVLLAYKYDGEADDIGLDGTISNKKNLQGNVF